MYSFLVELYRFVVKANDFWLFSQQNSVAPNCRALKITADDIGC